MIDRLVVVEDAPEIREMMVLYLQNAGFEVYSTDSGRQCLLMVSLSPGRLVDDVRCANS